MERDRTGGFSRLFFVLSFFFFFFGGGGKTELVHTPRIRNSTNLFDAERPRRVDIAADQEDVSSVVVLNTYVSLALQ